MESKVVLITGASSGIGKSIAEFLMQNGCKVYGTSRRAGAKPVPETITASPSADANIPGGGFLKMIQLDVRSDESVSQAVDQVWHYEGRIDVLINNAGYGIAGAIELTTPEEAGQQFDTNFFGVLRMCRKVIPLMRQQKKGLIINIGSVAGIIAIPFQSMYSASKFAVEAMSEALRIEVKPFGIKVTLVEPGDTRTAFTDSRQYVTAAETSNIYHERFHKSINAMAESERHAPPPDAVVKEVLRIIKKKNPPVRVTAGFTYKLIVFLKRLIPAKLLEFIVTKLY